MSKKNKICDVCGKKWDFAISTGVDFRGRKWCKHDNDVRMRYELAYIKRQREEYAVDLLQPRLPDGKLNPDFVKVYGIPQGTTKKELRDLET